MSFCGLDQKKVIASDDNIIDINDQDGDGSTSLLGEHGIIILRLCISLMKTFGGEFGEPLSGGLLKPIERLF